MSPLPFSKDFRVAPTLLALCILGLSGCSTEHYQESADKEVEEVIAEKTPRVPNLPPGVEIDDPEALSLESFPLTTEREEFFGDESDFEVGARMLGLRDALEVAFEYSRTYRSQKEVVYLQALDLTFQRHRYRPIPFGSVDATYQETAVAVQNGVDELTTERTVRVGGSVGFDWLLATGGRLGLAFTADFLKFLGGDEPQTTASVLQADLVQPLLQGAGYTVAMEALTQAERDLLYTLRDFVRFRRSFSVEIAADYYNILQARDRVRNNWIGFQSFIENERREIAFAQEGQRTQTQLGQIQQAKLEAELNWINSVRDYRQLLDLFKIRLGLPVDTKIVLNPEELDRLRLIEVDLLQEQAVEIALASRLDLYTERDLVEDAARRVEIASNGLLPRADLVLSADVRDKPDGGFPQPDFDRYSWAAGLNVELPFDRKAERNTFRRAQIALAQRIRGYDLALDEVRLNIADAWRDLEQARRNYEISQLSVELAERRVEEQRILNELGEGTARDLVEAEQDLTTSLNRRTAALIDHVLTRLNLWQDLGILYVDEEGYWQDFNIHSGESAIEDMPEDVPLEGVTTDQLDDTGGEVPPGNEDADTPPEQ